MFLSKYRLDSLQKGFHYYFGLKKQFFSIQKNPHSPKISIKLLSVLAYSKTIDSFRYSNSIHSIFTGLISSIKVSTENNSLYEKIHLKK